MANAICPKCGSEMKIRNGRRGEFWGCSKFPRCKGTKSIGGYSKKFKAEQKTSEELAGKIREEQIRKLRELVPSEYQQKVLDFVTNDTGNAVIEAVAGSGKTTTLLMALAETSGKVAFTAFNKSIATELSQKAPGHVQVSTMHSFGFSAVKSGLGRTKVDNYKLKNIIDSVLPQPEDKEARKAQRKVKRFLSSIVPLAKATLCNYSSMEDLSEVISHYSVDNGELLQEYHSTVVDIMEQCKNQKSIIDFDDMIWFPVVHNLEMPKFDFVFVDEAQDLNRVQMELTKKMVNTNGRIVCVGDRFQSIYGFRGADTQAIPNLIAELEAKVLPLSICYRCPTSHIRLAKEIVPHIEARNGAEEGEIVTLDKDKMTEAADNGDMILCRVNAPLVSLCFGFIRDGKKAIIRGRDIGQGLIKLINRFDPSNIEDLYDKLEEYRRDERVKLERIKNEAAIMVLEDKCECLLVFMGNSNSVDEVKDKIERLFSDNSGTGIVLSSVHKAKGLEADNVYIAKPDLMPHPLAESQWQREQEMNVRYVALTRAKKRLAFVEMD